MGVWKRRAAWKWPFEVMGRSVTARGSDLQPICVGRAQSKGPRPWPRGDQAQLGLGCLSPCSEARACGPHAPPRVTLMCRVGRLPLFWAAFLLGLCPASRWAPGFETQPNVGADVAAAPVIADGLLVWGLWCQLRTSGVVSAEPSVQFPKRPFSLCLSLWAGCRAACGATAWQQAQRGAARPALGRRRE